jgi:hypothetical protein
VIPCREALTGSAHQAKGLDRRGPRHQEATMPKYLLLTHNRGGPEPHIAFQRDVIELLEVNGEYVDAQALTPARTWVRHGGPDAALATRRLVDARRSEAARPAARRRRTPSRGPPPPRRAKDRRLHGATAPNLERERPLAGLAAFPVARGRGRVRGRLLARAVGSRVEARFRLCRDPAPALARARRGGSPSGAGGVPTCSAGVAACGAKAGGAEASARARSAGRRRAPMPTRPGRARSR